MNKTVLVSSLLAVTLISALVYLQTSKVASNPTGPRPANFRKCETKDYKLEFISLDVDHDIEPGKATIMNSKWMPHEDMHFEKMNFQHFFLQAMDGPRQAENINLAIELCKKRPLWRLSLQQHKLIHLP